MWNQPGKLARCPLNPTATMVCDASMTSLRSTFVVLTIAAAGMAALLAFLTAAGHDQLWFLLMARRWLDGAALYGPQAFDSNPPAIVWLSAIPLLLGRVMHLPATAIAKLLVVIAETASASFSYHLIRRSKRPQSLPDRSAFMLAFLLLGLVVPARRFRPTRPVALISSSALRSRSGATSHRISGPGGPLRRWSHGRSRNLHQAPVRRHPRYC